MKSVVNILKNELVLIGRKIVRINSALCFRDKKQKQKNKVELEMSIPANDINDQKDDDKKKYGCYNS